MDHHDVALLIHRHLAIRVSLAIFRDVLDLGADAEPHFQMRVLWFKVRLHPAAFENDLNRVTASALLEVIVDAACLPCPRGCGADTDCVSRVGALHVVIREGVLLAFPEKVFGAEAVDKPRILSETEIGLGLVRLLRQLDHLGVRLCRPSPSEILHVEVACRSGPRLARVRHRLERHEASCGSPEAPSRVGMIQPSSMPGQP
mmetsp:Transcript_101561/g.286394  ORF Transcript_101561/g.286394 Transcript_101561/m.286394 type:complete len:202 (-) Transcript_101561:196-801(-)